MKKRDVVIAALGLILLPLAAAGQDRWEALRQRGRITIVSVKDSSVQDYFLDVDRDGNLTGFDGEILGGFCRRYGLTPRLEVLKSWSDFVPALLEGKADIAAGEITASAARQKIVSFTAEVFPTRLVAVNYKPAPPIRTMQEFSKARVGVTEGSSMVDILAGLIPQENILRLAIGNLFKTLEAGGVDALVWGIEQALVDARKYPRLQLGMFVGPRESLAYALRKEEQGLRSRLNNYIAELRRNGAWEKLIIKYFGAEAPAALERATGI